MPSARAAALDETRKEKPSATFRVITLWTKAATEADRSPEARGLSIVNGREAENNAARVPRHHSRDTRIESAKVHAVEKPATGSKSGATAALAAILSTSDRGPMTEAATLSVTVRNTSLGEKFVK
jgi:hypothetical protein